MKKLSLLTFLFLIALISPVQVFATPQILSIEPNPTTSDRIITMTGQCDEPKGNSKFNWERDDGQTGNSIVIQYDKNPVVFPVKLEVGVYTVNFECNGSYSTKKTLTVDASVNRNGVARSFSVSPQPVVAGIRNVTFKIQGCPLNDTVVVSYYSSIQTGGVATANTDENGAATTEPRSIDTDGSYIAEVTCNDEKVKYPFTVGKWSQPLTFNITPNPGIANSTDTKLIVQGCPANSPVNFSWSLGLHSDSSNPDPISDGNGAAFFTQEEGFNPGDYTATITCATATIGPLPFKIIKSPNKPTFDTEPKVFLANDEKSRLLVKGCPNGPVHLEWKNSTAINYAGSNLTSKSGIAELFKAFDPGDYTVRISCGGHNALTVLDDPSYVFKVSNDHPTPTITPTPPSPPCNATLSTDDASCIEVNTALGDIQTDPILFIKRMFGLFLSISGGVGVVMVMYAGYKYILSRGDPDKTKQARELLTSAILGFLFLIFSMVILQIIGVDILRIPGFGA